MQTNIYTLCKSGNHAIIFWIIHNLGGYSETHSQREVVYKSSDNNLCFINNINHPVIGTPKIQDILQYKNILISYEDFFKQDIDQSNDIIVLRDFYNTLASRYRLFKPLLGIKNQDYIHTLENLMLYWKHWANLAIQSNRYIYYNLWLTNKNYRDHTMMKYFNTDNHNDNTEFVPNIGSGSSYIGFYKEHDIQNYMSRYYSTSLPDEWRQLVDSDKEISTLCESLLHKSL